MNWKGIEFYVKLFTTLLLLIPFGGIGQTSESDSGNRNEIAFLLGYGGSDLNILQLDIQYEYQVRILQLQYSYVLLPDRRFDINIHLMPQLSFSRFKHHDSDLIESHGVEIGVTAGLAPEFHTLDKKFGVFLLISSGPVYISGGPERQTSGFNFATNLMTGFKLRIRKKTYVKLQSGFRHLSNASIKEPNGGLNNLIVNGGLAFTY